MAILKMATLPLATMLAFSVGLSHGLADSPFVSPTGYSDWEPAPVVDAALYSSGRVNRSTTQMSPRAANAVETVSYQDHDSADGEAYSGGNYQHFSDGQSSTMSCSSPAVGSCCDGHAKGCCTCCVPWWAHKNGVFGELLYLFAGSSDTIYAVEQSGLLPSSSPTGPVGRTDIGGEVGFRVGFSYALSNKASLVASFARWDGDAFDAIEATGTNLLSSTIVHPSTTTVGSDSLNAEATQNINFQLIDAMFRRVFRAADCGVINWNAGLRYGRLEQEFTARQTMAVATGLTSVSTEADFSGFGIISGLDGERQSADTGCFVYGRALASLLAGNWRAGYQQSNQFGTGIIANRYEDFRVSPVVDTEIGLGWKSRGDHLRISTGYLFSTWFNAVNNRDYIQAVRNGNLLGLDQSLTFSGLTFRTELRF